MVVEFSPRCDGCHTVFKERDDDKREPVTVGCCHTLCRACAEGDKGAYGALQHLAARADDEQGEGEGEGEGEEDEVDPRVKALVRGKCGVCGRGKEGEIVVRDVALDALRRAAGDGGAGNAPGNDAKMCGVCGEDEGGGKHVATHFCEDCSEHMCDEATKFHKRIKATSQHTVNKLEGAEPSPAQPLCRTHNRPFLDFFCKEDKCFVCAECIVGDHHGHTFVREGAELVGEIKGWLGHEIEKAEARVGELEGAEDGFVEDRTELMASARQAIDTIAAIFYELEKKRDELIDEVAKVRKETCQRLNDVRTTSRMLRQGIEAVQRVTQSLGHSPSHLAVQEAERAGQQLRQLVEECNEVCTQRGNTVVIFKHSEDRLKAWRDSLGLAFASNQPEEEEEWEARGGVSSQSLPSLNTPRAFHSAAVVTPFNHVFVVGGCSDADKELNSVERLEDDGSAWTAGLTIPTARDWCGACAVGTALVVVGGENPTRLDVVEAVDTVSGVRTTLPPLPNKAEGCAAVNLQGKVIVTGGYDGSSHLNKVWLLDVGNDANLHDNQQLKWTPLPDLMQARSKHGSAAGGGCVFVCAGSNGSDLDSCEMLRIVGEGQGVWEVLPPLPHSRRNVGCCYRGGNVFVAGGQGDRQSLHALNVRERTWTRVGALDKGRNGCAAVCVGRRVMVLGGRPEYRCEVFEF